MSMFCYQCQETAKNEGCTIKGVCGKDADVANLQDLLVFVLKGISVYAEKANEEGLDLSDKTAPFIMEGLFATCLLYTSPSPRDRTRSRMPSSA